MSDLTIASTTSSEAELRHAVSENWRTPPGRPTDAPDDSGRERVVPLDKADAKDYNRIRDQQVAEKKFEGPEFLKDDKQKPHKKSGWERRIDKLTAVNSRLQRELEQARKPPAEVKATIATQAAPIKAPQAQPSRTEQPAASAPSKAAANGNPSGSPLNRPEYNPAFVEAARAIPGIEKIMADADAIDIGQALHDVLVKATTAADRPKVIKFLKDSPNVLKEWKRNPEQAAEHVARFLRDDAASRARAKTNLGAREFQLVAAADQRLIAALKGRPDGQKLFNVMKQEPLERHAIIAAVEHENAHEIMLHLAEHRNLFAEVNRMPPMAAAAKIGRIAEQLEAAKREAAKPKERVRPPDPIKTVGSSSSSSSVPLDQMPPREYNRIRNKQERDRKSRR